MGSNLTPTSEKDLNGFLFARSGGQPQHADLREIKQSIDLSSNQLSGIRDIGELLFSNSKFTKQVSIGDYRRAGNIKFSNCEFIENVFFNTLSNIEFTECIFRKNLTLNINDLKAKRELSDFTIDGTFHVSGSPGVSIVLRNINVSSGINNQELIISADIMHPVFDNVWFKKIHFEPPGTIKDGASFNNMNVEELILGNQIIEPVIRIMGSYINMFWFGGAAGVKRSLQISSKSFIGYSSMSLKDFESIEISDCIIDFLHIDNKNKPDDVFTIQRSTILYLQFQKVINTGLITLRDIEMPGKGRLTIIECNLGKIDFINCDFSKAFLEFENSKISEAFLSEADFPRVVRISDKKNFRQAQLAFGQLSTAFQKQGDTVRALEYQSREIAAHFREIGSNFPKWKYFKDIFTWLNLLLNLISNRFGRNWALGLVFSVIVGLFFFSALLVSTGKYVWSWEPTWDWELMPAFLKFMNPLRFIDTETLFRIGQIDQNITLNKWSYLCDFLGRVFVAYGYYQTIQAFRRYGRK